MTMTSFTLPDLHIVCPLTGSTSPHYEKAGPQSSAWVNSYNIFIDRKRAEFVQGCNELLVSHTYPYADFDQFRTCCDFVNLLFVVDEVSDEQNGKDANVTCQIFLNAMKDPDWTDGSNLCQMTKECVSIPAQSYISNAIHLPWFRRLVKTVLSTFANHFLGLGECGRYGALSPDPLARGSAK